jgi:hypothetical protein
MRSGAFTSVDLTRALLERIDAIDGDVKAYLTVTGDRRWNRPLLPTVDAPPAMKRRCWVCPWPSKMCSRPRACRRPAAARSSKAICRPTRPRRSNDLSRPAWSCWARPTPTSLPWVPAPKTAATSPPTIRGIWSVCRAAAVAARPQRWRPTRRWAHWVPTRAAACASRPRSAALSASSPPTGVSAATGWSPTAAAWTRSAP